MRNDLRLFGVLAVSILAACDRSGLELLPAPNDNVPTVAELGELKVLGEDELPSAFTPSNCNQLDEEGRFNCYYGMVSATDGVTVGGATFGFEGTGGDVCVLVDPEAVFWNRYIGGSDSSGVWGYPAPSQNSGDLDLFGGLSSYYTGSPGVEIGDFSGFYTDSLGREVAIDYVECYNASPYDGTVEAHGGRGAPEYCTIDTSGREGILYTIVLETFKIPNDDGLLAFGTVVVEGKCSAGGGLVGSGAGPGECTMLGESIDESGGTRACSAGLELAYCNNIDSPASARVLSRFCCSYPEMCGENPPEEICQDHSKEVFCTEFPEICEQCD